MSARRHAVAARAKAVARNWSGGLKLVTRAHVAVPLFAVVGAFGGQYALGSLGTTIGEAICQ